MKSLKKIIIKNKLIVGMLIALIILATGTFYYINYRMDTSVTQPPVSTEEGRQQGTESDDTSVRTNVDNKKVPETEAPSGTTTNTPQSDNVTDITNSVSLQGVMNQQSQVATVSLYGMAAYYTIEVMEGESYKTLHTNVFYQGSGGLQIGELKSNSPTGPEYKYRIYPVIDGVKSSTYSEVLLDWNLIRSTGVSSFKGAQAN